MMIFSDYHFAYSYNLTQNDLIIGLEILIMVLELHHQFFYLNLFYLPLLEHYFFHLSPILILIL